MNEDKSKFLKVSTLNYQGEVQLENEEQGFGNIDYSNGNYYVGLGKTQGKTIIKEGFGYYHYENGSLYVGQWHEELKHGQGILFYNNGDIYYGDWEKNSRKGTGIYFWNSTKDNATSKSKYYQASIGEFNKNRIIRGIMHYSNQKENESPNETNQYLFIGEFNFNGEKDDKNGILYDFKRKFFFIGNFVKDIIKDLGFEVFFDESKNQVNDMITVRLGEEKKSEGKVEELWNFVIDIASKETEKSFLSNEEKENCKTRVSKMFLSYILGDSLTIQFESLYDILVSFKKEILIDTKISINEMKELNEAIQNIKNQYPEWDSLFSSNPPLINNNDKEEKENEEDSSHNTETGASLFLD